MDPASSGTDAYAPFKASSALTCGSGAGCAQIIYQVPEGVSQTHANAPADTPHVDYGGFIRVHPRGVKLTNTRLEIPGGDTRPSTCEGTDVWLDTDATSGKRIYACESGSWVLQGDGSAVPAPIASSTGGALTINTITMATAAGDYDIPDSCDTATGSFVTVIVRDASEVVSLTTSDTGDIFVYKGIATLAANDELDSPGAAMDGITAVCIEANTWYITSNSGNWVDGGAAD